MSTEQQLGAGTTATLRTWALDTPPLTGTYTLGNRELDPDLESTVATMAAGEHREVKLINKINNKEQVVNVELLAVQEGQGGMRGVAAQAEEGKKQGNAYIKQKRYAEAIGAYEAGYNLIEYSCDQQSLQLRLSLLSNLALACLNENKFRQCLEWCRRYTAQSAESNKKIVYRQISALKGLREWSRAKEAVGGALEEFKADAEALADFRNLKEAIEKEEKQVLAKQKKVYHNMFS